MIFVAVAESTLQPKLPTLISTSEVLVLNPCPVRVTLVPPWIDPLVGKTLVTDNLYSIVGMSPELEENNVKSILK